jgi:peptidylprolyl isomerase
MQKAKVGDHVKVIYLGTLDDGTVFDSSQDSEPKELTIGSGSFIRGFESAIIGMSPGESRITRVAAAEAYGPHKEALVATVDRSHMPSEVKLKLGKRLKARATDGREIAVTVTGISSSTVTVDANHPLAGKDLTFEIELLEIVRAA